MPKLKTDLWEHQKKAVELAQKLGSLALFFEMGTGKTLTQISILCDKLNATRHGFRVLIFCPLVVVANWKREFLLHSDIPASYITTLEGPGKKRVRDFTRNQNTPHPHIFISNYESLLMKDLFALYMAWKPQVLIFDESHKLKTHNSGRTKAASKLADVSEYKYLLSGTPVLNSPMDLFSQYRVMDGGKSFSKNFYQFRLKYFYDSNAGMPKTVHFPDWKIKPKALEAINKIVNDTSMRVTKEECLDLPPLIRQTRYVDMTPVQRKMYTQMKKDFVTFLDDKACVAQLALTKGLRLMQIVSGFIKLEDNTEVSLPATPRERDLSDLLEELTPKHKVIVWAVFKHNFKQIIGICEKLGVEYAEVHGGISAKSKQENIDRFNTDDRCRVFIGHPGAGGIGVNLTISDYSIYFSRNFSLEQDLQSEARNHRGGSERHEKITRIDLVCPDTIDDLVLKMLAKKQKLGEDLLQAIRAGEEI